MKYIAQLRIMLPFASYNICSTFFTHYKNQLRYRLLCVNFSKRILRYDTFTKFTMSMTNMENVKLFILDFSPWDKKIVYTGTSGLVFISFVGERITISSCKFRQIISNKGTVRLSRRVFVEHATVVMLEL